MKIIYKSAVIILLFANFVLLFGCVGLEKQTPTDGEKNTLSFLHAECNDLVDENGNIVVLKGVNFGGWLVQENWMCPTNSKDQLTAYTILTERFGIEKMRQLFKQYEDNWIDDEDFVYVGELGFNCIRLPFTYWNIMDEKGDYTDFSRLDYAVEQCEKNGLYVILDLHGAKGSQNGYDNSGDTSFEKGIFFSEKEYQEEMICLWERVAEHFKDKPNVAGYDLLNEPAGQTGTTDSVQFDWYESCYNAIRRKDAGHLIIMESCWETDNLPNPNQEPYFWENVMYEYHNYLWNADNDYNAQKTFVDKKVRSYQALSYDVPKLIGEFTFFNNYDSWQYGLNAYLSCGASYTVWTYKVVAEDSSWGILNGQPERVDIENDSFDTIMKKWSNVGTKESFYLSKTGNFFKKFNTEEK